MIKKYSSDFYKSPIEVENINWEIFVSITTNEWKKIIYSWYDIIDKTSYSPYIKNSILSSFVWNIPENLLIIWFWAWSYAKYFKDYLWEKIDITWIEIDKSMLEIAKKEFNLNKINYFNLDYLEALKILNKKKNNKFDTIFIDIYDNNSKIPENFNNIENIKLIKNILTPNWKIIVNYANTEKHSVFYKQIHSKLLDIFWHNYIKILNSKTDTWNIIWVYNLDKKYNSEELILEYLTKVQNLEINYDSNIISNIFLEK